MTKAGYKQIMVSIDTYEKIKMESSKQGISIGMLIYGLLDCPAEPSALNPTAVGSNPSQPAIDFSKNDAKTRWEKNHSKDIKKSDILSISEFERLLKLQKCLGERTVESKLLQYLCWIYWKQTNIQTSYWEFNTYIL